MTDGQTITTILLGLLATAVAWIFKTVIQQGKDVARLQAAFTFYLDTRGRGAALLLDAPNPIPPEIRTLIHKNAQGQTLSASEYADLTGFLRKMIVDDKADRGRRAAALEILSGMGTMDIVHERSH
jgi:hypothetical protein